jgi:heptosyltransferase-2
VCRDHDPIRERLLIIKLGALGDVLRTTSCLPRLKALHPQSHVTWVTRGDAVPLLRRNPSIDRVLSVDSNYLEYLLAERFDLVAAPDAEPLSASIAGLARSATKRGFIADGRGGVQPLNDAAEYWWRMGLDDELKRQNRRTYGEWLYAILELPLPVERPYLHVPVEVRADTSRRLQEQAPHATTTICFNTGASRRWEEKRWKAPHYVALAQRIAAEHVDAAIVLIGGEEEHPLIRDILSSGTTFIDGGSNNSLEEFAAILSVSSWVLTPDSLGYHVACAVGTRAACLVGPTSPWEIDLYADNRVIHSPFDCIACYRATCPKPTTCMDALTADAVWSSVRDWMTIAESSRVLLPVTRC